jgi:hypothetical protein
MPRSGRNTKPPKGGKSAASFRCPSCHVMVSANAEGKCPKCGASPPRAIELPSEALPLPGAVQTTGLPRWIPYGIVSTRWDRGKGAAVGGEASLKELGLKATFPAGWHRLAGSQARHNILGSAAQLSTFYRGERSDDPAITADIGVIEGRLVPPEAGEIIPDIQFQDLLENVANATVTLTRTSAEISSEDCKILVIAMRRTGRCTAPAGPDGIRQIAVYYWLMGDSTGVALFEAEGELEPLLREADEIVGTIESIAPITDGDEGEASDEAPPAEDEPAAETDVDAAP